MPHLPSYARVPSPRSEWPQAGDPAQDQAELLLRLVSSRQPRPRCPFLSAERGAPGERQGVSPAHFTPRQTALWAVFEHRRAQKDGLSASLQEIWNGYRLIFLFLQQVFR